MKSERRGGIPILSVVMLLCIAAVCFIAFFVKDNDGKPQNAPFTSDGAQTTAGTTDYPRITESDAPDTGTARVTVTEEPATTAAPVTDPPTTEPPVTEPPVTRPPETQPYVTHPPATDPIITYPPATQPPSPETGEQTQPPETTPEKVGRPIVTAYPVAASDRVDDSFFADAVFVGDSRTQGLQLYGDIRNATYYAYQGLNVVTAQNNTFIYEDNQSFTIAQAIARHPELKKIYICLGVNEFWMYEGTYRTNYEILIDSIMAANPDAAIYIYAITPLFDGLEQSSNGLNNEKMERFNQIAKEIAMARGIYYLDAAEPFTKGDGRRYLDRNESGDGIHLNGYGISKITEYFRTHTK